MQSKPEVVPTQYDWRSQAKGNFGQRQTCTGGRGGRTWEEGAARCLQSYLQATGRERMLGAFS